MLAAVIGVLVSLASWAFLELVHAIQVGVYTDLPGDLGFDTVPSWWPLPWLALAAILTAFAIQRLPGHGGHVPADELSTGGEPLNRLSFRACSWLRSPNWDSGSCSGPEAPLIALGMGLGILALRLVRKDAPQQAVGLMAAAGSFAAVSTIFGR